ncbi:MAG: MinD/ParA family protein [Lachnospiraceae bacterium]|nr:MinD/ParA family protein [Lachnospiraceae bacterium]
MIDQAEQLRKRVSQQIQHSGSTRVIAVTSGKGGVGKTSFSVNLAIQLSKRGKKVVIIDADFGLANVEIMLGIRPQYNMADLIYHEMNVDDIITKGPLDIGFISGGSGVQDMVNLDKEQVKILIPKLVRLDSLADVIIIDTGAGISDAVLEFVLSSPEVIIVATPEPTSITDAYSLLKTVNRSKDFMVEEKKIQIVSNRVGSKEEGKEIYDKLNIVSTKFLNIHLEYLGAIMQDSNASKAIIEQKPVSLAFPNSISTRCYQEIGNKLLEIDEVVDEPKEGIATFFLDFIRQRRKKN